MRISVLVLAFASALIMLTPAVSNAQTSSRVQVVNLAQPPVAPAVPAVNLNVAKAFMHNGLMPANPMSTIRTVDLGTHYAPPAVTALRPTKVKLGQELISTNYQLTSK